MYLREREREEGRGGNQITTQWHAKFIYNIFHCKSFLLKVLLSERHSRKIHKKQSPKHYAKQVYTKRESPNKYIIQKYRQYKYNIVCKEKGV